MNLPVPILWLFLISDYGTLVLLNHAGEQDRLIQFVQTQKLIATADTETGNCIAFAYEQLVMCIDHSGECGGWGGGED